MIKPKRRRRVRRVGKTKLYEYSRPMTLAERREERKRAKRAAESNAAILKASVATLKRVVRMVERGEAFLLEIKAENDIAYYDDWIGAPGGPKPFRRGQRMVINLSSPDFTRAWVAPKLPDEEK